MRRNPRSTACVAPLAIALLGFTVGCEQPADPISPESVAPRLGHSPGHGKGGGGGGGGNEPELVTLDITGGFVTTAEPAGVVTDNKNRLEIGGIPGSCADDPFCFNVELSLASLAGNPTPATLDDLGCVTNPADLATSDPATLDRLIGHLDDPAEGRIWGFSVDKKKAGSPDPDHGARSNGWWDPGPPQDPNSYRYRAGLDDHDPALPGSVTATEVATDVWSLSGGSVQIKSTPLGGGIFDFSLTCPAVAGESVDIVITRN